MLCKHLELVGGFSMEQKTPSAPISQQEQIIIAKIRTLSPERLVEVEAFIDLLRLSDEERGC